MAITIYNKEQIEYGTTVTLVTIQCYKCSVPFAIPQRLDDYFRETKHSFFCPNGHSQAYVTSVSEGLRKKLSEQEQSNLRMKNLLSSKNETIGALERQKSAIKGQVTKIKNRVSNGVCPCCNRTFENLANHMKHQHPEFKQP